MKKILYLIAVVAALALLIAESFWFPIWYQDYMAAYFPTKDDSGMPLAFTMFAVWFSTLMIGVVSAFKLSDK